MLDRFKGLPQAAPRQVLTEDILAPESGHRGTAGQSCEKPEAMGNPVVYIDAWILFWGGGAGGELDIVLQRLK